MPPFNESGYRHNYNPQIIDCLRPVQRSSAEVKELAQHFLHFPGLLPRMEMEVLVGMASRAKMEQIPKQAVGYSRVYTYITKGHYQFVWLFN